MTRNVRYEIELPEKHHLENTPACLVCIQIVRKIAPIRASTLYAQRCGKPRAPFSQTMFSAPVYMDEGDLPQDLQGYGLFASQLPWMLKTSACVAGVSC